jgi:hypothetical protein
VLATLYDELRDERRSGLSSGHINVMLERVSTARQWLSTWPPPWVLRAHCASGQIYREINAKPEWPGLRTSQEESFYERPSHRRSGALDQLRGRAK